MYESYWQLESKPFENTTDARFYYPDEVHQGALLKLRYAVENRRAAALLAGAAGLGKTLLAKALVRQLGEACRTIVHVVFPEMPPDQLLAYLADELTGERSTQAVSIQQSIRRLQDVFADNAAADRHALVILDEAHLLRDAHALETVRLLLNFEQQHRPAMTVLLIGQPALLPTLDRMPQLDVRLAVKCLLRPFTPEETLGYIQHRLSAAGARREIFDSGALEAAHYLSHGVARRINRLCDLALLIGFAEERRKIGAAQLEAVAEELVTVAPD